jgi:hypothetical protein
MQHAILLESKWTTLQGRILLEQHVSSEEVSHIWFKGISGFITTIIGACHILLSWAKLIQSTSSPPCFSYNQSKYYTHACSLVSQVASLLWVFQSILFATFFSDMCAYSVSLDLFILFSIWWSVTTHYTVFYSFLSQFSFVHLSLTSRYTPKPLISNTLSQYSSCRVRDQVPYLYRKGKLCYIF